MQTWKKGKFAASLLSVSLLAGTVLAACTGGPNSSGAPAAGAGGEPAASGDPYDKLPRELSINVRDGGSVPSEEGNMQDNRWTKWINEQSGVKVGWVTTPPSLGETIQKLNTLVAAGEGPTLIAEANRPFLTTLVDNGSLQPIDEYVEKYSTSFKKYLADHPDLKEWLTFDDGKMYLVGTLRTGWQQLVHGGYIRQDWLDKLNLPMPKTMEELIEVARAFKERDPDGNGQADTVGITIDLNMMNGPFYLFYATGNSPYWYVENGKPQFASTAFDRLKLAIDANRTIYQEGLIDKEYLTDKNFERSKQLWATGKSGIMLGGANGVIGSYKDFKKNNPNAVVAPLPPISTPAYANGYNQATGLAGTMIGFNRTLKNPKAAIEFLDWMLDEGSETLANGFEEQHYKLVNGVKTPIDPNKNKKELSYANGYSGIMRVDTTSFEDLLKNPSPDPVQLEIDKLRVESAKTFLSVKFRRELPVLPNIKEVNDATTSYLPFFDQTISKAVVGGDKYTTEMAIEDLKKEWSRIGGEKADQLMLEWYQKRPAK